MRDQSYLSDVELLQLILKQLETISQKLPKDQGTKPVQFGYIDTAQLLRLLNITERTAIKWRNNGTLKYSKVNGKIFYKLSDVEAMIRQHAG